MVLNADLRVRSVNQSFYQTFKTTPPETEGRLIYDLGNAQWDIPRLRELLEEIIPQNSVFDNFEVEHDFPGIGACTMMLNARRLDARTGHPSLILLAMEDVTLLKHLGDQVQEALNYAQGIVETVREPLLVLDSDLKVRSVNQSFYQTFKTTQPET